MRIVTFYAHLNGHEFMLVHKKQLWIEIENVIAGVDAGACRTKESRERRTKGRKFYSPIAMNKALSESFKGQRWGESRTSYWVTSDAQQIRKIMQ